MGDLIKSVFEVLLKDPYIGLSIAVILGLFYLLDKREKTITEMAKTIEGLHEVINTNLAEGNRTMTQLVTLVEVMVYGRNRNENP